jgi:hypothetical protein
VELEDRVGLASDEKAALARELARIVTLHDLIQWGLERGWVVSAVVVQDEYTHDVVIPWRGAYLVFDTT